MFITVLHQSPTLRIGAIDSLLVCAWSGGATLEALDEMAKHEQALVDQHGAVSLLMVFSGTPKQAEPGVKERGDELAQRFKGVVRSNVVLVQARGLSGVVVRTFLAGFSLLSPIPMESAATVAEAVAKLQAVKGQSAALCGNVHLGEQLRAFLEPAGDAGRAAS